MTITNEQLTRVHLTWCTDILQRIHACVKDPKLTDGEKLSAIGWYAKQGLKVEREE